MANSIKKTTFYLSTDLVYHALLWLPIKTLIRFKSVCKAWFALIENPYFIEKYQKLQSVRELDPICNYMLVTASSSGYVIYLLYCNDASHKLIESDTSYFSDMKSESSSLYGMKYWVVVGIDNGLVCLCSYFSREEIFICNPTTRQLRKIPPFQLSSSYHYDIVFLGFGSLVNDYELIRIVCSFVDDNSPVLHAESYTKGIDTWRDIEIKLEASSWLWRLKNCQGIPYSEAVLINGVFYWKAVCDGHQFVPFFDIQKGVFDVIETPLETRPAGGYQLYGLKDKLALIKCKHFSESIWILNENLTWTEVKIDFSAIPDYISIFKSKISVLGSTRNDELVLKGACGGNLKLFLYDINSQEIKILYDVNYKGCIYKLYLYTPALTPVS